MNTEFTGKSFVCIFENISTVFEYLACLAYLGIKFPFREKNR